MFSGQNGRFGSAGSFLLRERRRKENMRNMWEWVGAVCASATSRIVEKPSQFCVWSKFCRSHRPVFIASRAHRQWDFEASAHIVNRPSTSFAISGPDDFGAILRYHAKLLLTSFTRMDRLFVSSPRDLLRCHVMKRVTIN